MADRYLLESGAGDGYLLEDGTGVLLKEVPPIAFVQALLGATRNTTGTSTVASGSVTVTAGNTIFVVAASFVNSGFGSESVTDNLGNVYSLVVRRRAAGDSERNSLYMAPVTVGGTMTTLTYNHDSSQFVGTVSAEYRNVGNIVSTYDNDGTGTTATWLGSTSIPAGGFAVGGTMDATPVNFTVGAANGTPSTTQVEADGWSTTGLAATIYHALTSVAVTGFTGSATMASDDWVGVGAVYYPVGFGTSVTPTPVALVTATFAPTVTVATGNVTVTPDVVALALTSFAPVIALAVTPTTASLALTTFAPVVALAVIPTTASLSLTTFAPTVLTPVTVTPSTLALTLATFAPTVSTPVLATPTAASLTLATFAPTVSTSANQVATPDPVALSLTAFAPTVTATAHVVVTPITTDLTTATFAPTVATTANVLVTPAPASLTLTTFRPMVTATGQDEDLTWVMEPTLGHSIRVVVRPAHLVLTTYPPRVYVIDDGDMLTLLQLIA